jgi:LacI family transcriptional regulator
MEFIMSVTLQEVAKLAGVSVGTASQALNNNPKVTAETRSRVLDAARTLGYSFKEKENPKPGDAQINVLGVLSKHDVGDLTLINPFYSHIIAGIEAECRRLGIGLMYSSIEVDHQNRPIEWPTMIDNRLVDGLIFVGTQIEGTAQNVKERFNIPTVLIDSYNPNLFFDSILTDNMQGAESAMKHLIDLGHRHIGLIGSKKFSVPSIAERRKSYIQTLQAHELFNENYILDSELDRPGSYETSKKLKEENPQITAFFACNDDCATAVIAAMHDLGLNVPQDVSVVGFDNIALSGEINPPLTTVHVHKNWMGILGVRFLLDRCMNPDKPKATLLISTQLVVRESSASPKA